MSRRKIVELVIGVALLALIVSLARYLTGPSFNGYVRQRIVSVSYTHLTLPTIYSV